MSLLERWFYLASGYYKREGVKDVILEYGGFLLIAVIAGTITFIIIMVMR